MGEDTEEDKAEEEGLKARGCLSQIRKLDISVPRPESLQQGHRGCPTQQS